MSPRLSASPLMAWVSLRRGSGARDLTNASTCGETLTLVFIQDGHIPHFGRAALVIGNGLHRLTVSQNFQGFNDCLHPASRNDVSHRAPIPGQRDGAFSFRAPDNGWAFPLQIRDGTYIFHKKSMYAMGSAKSMKREDFRRAVSRILSAPAEPGERIICLSSQYPKPVPRNGTRSGPLLGFLFGLAPDGVFRALAVARQAVGSCPTFSPLPRPCGRGGLFSVALSVEMP